MGKTKIEWANKVWNPLRGCSRVSPGCENCYAERIAARFSWPAVFIPDNHFSHELNEPAGPFHGTATMTQAGPRWTGNVFFIEDKLYDPLRWRAPARIFVNSMSDLFHEKVEDHWIDKIFAIMAIAKKHTFQILTKRPERMRDYMFSSGGLRSRVIESLIKKPTWLGYPRGRSFPSNIPHWPLPNVWLGVSVEDQYAADKRIPILLDTPAAIRWISAEPLLGPVDLSGYMPYAFASSRFPEAKLGWCVVGGESGPGARPMDLEWAKAIRRQCASGGVPFFMKQLGGASSKMTDLKDIPKEIRVREYPKTVVTS